MLNIYNEIESLVAFHIVHEFVLDDIAEKCNRNSTFDEFEKVLYEMMKTYDYIIHEDGASCMKDEFSEYLADVKFLIEFLTTFKTEGVL